MHASYAMYIYIFIKCVCVNGDMLHNKVHDLQLTTNIFMTNPCEKTGPAFTPATYPPAFSNLVGSTEHPRSPCQRTRVGVCMGCFATKLWKHAREKFPMSKFASNPKRIEILVAEVFFFHMSTEDTHQSNKQRPLFLHMMLSGTLSSQATDHYIIATQHAQSAWQGHAFQTLVRFVSKCQFLQTVRQCHPFQTLVEPISTSQILQTVRQGHSVQTLVKVRSKSQTLQTVGQGHAFQTLVEAQSKRQALQTVRQGHPFQTLVEVIPKSQILQTVWQGHLFQTLVECITKSQILQTVRQCHVFQTLVEDISEIQILQAVRQGHVF